MKAELGAFIIIILLASYISGPALASDNDRYAASTHRGPLNVSNTFPAALFFLNYRPLQAENLRKGDYRILFDVDEANTIVVDQNLAGSSQATLDSELTQYRFDFSAGITSRLEVGLTAAILHYHGPFLDGFIEAVEGAAGRPSGTRKSRPKDKTRLHLTQNNSTMLDISSSMGDVGDMILRAKYAVLEESLTQPLDLTARFDIKLPTGSKTKGMGSGSTDFGMSVMAHKGFGRFHIQGDLAYQILGKLRLGGEYEPDNVLTAVLSTEYAWKTTSAVLQFMSTQSAFRSFGIPTLAEGGQAVVLGLKRDIGRNAVFQFSMTENISDVTFSDFSINAGIEYRFGKKNPRPTRKPRKKRN